MSKVGCLLAESDLGSFVGEVIASDQDIFGIRFFGREQMVHDAGQLVSSCGHGFRSAKAPLHFAVEFAEVVLGTV
jgi:hypothetical protein